MLLRPTSPSNDLSLIESRGFIDELNADYLIQLFLLTDIPTWLPFVMVAMETETEVNERSAFKKIKRAAGRALVHYTFPSMFF